MTGTSDPPPTDWDRILRPRSVAVLGATGRADSPMARPLRWLAERGFAGRVHPVNPRHDELAGLPCHRSLSAVPGPVDLVLALVPAEQAVEAVRDAGAVGAAAVVVFASGFAEVGDEGAALQDRLVAAARESGVRVLGPNCQGIVHTPTRLFATFTAAAERPLQRASGIAYIGQSGAVGGSVLDIAAEQGVDLTVWVSTGNEADVDCVEVGRRLVRDPDVAVLTLYVEAVRDGAAYARLAAEAADAGTGLVVLRSGRSTAGRRAAASHTGALVGDDTAFRLVSARHGVVLVDDVDELLAAAVLLRGGRRPGGRGVGAVTTSGGAGILAADRCADAGLTLPVLASSTQDELARLVPAFGAVANPVDVTAQLFNVGAHAFGEVCGIVCADAGVDALVVLVTLVVGEDADRLAEDIAAAAAAARVPVVVVWLAGTDRTAGAREILRRGGVPVFSSIAVAARVLGALVPDPDTDDDPPAVTVPPDVTDGWDLLRAIGVSTAGSRLVHDGAGAAGAAVELAGPDGDVVLKAVAPGLDHKTEAGAVRLGVPAQRAGAVHDELVATVPGVTGVLVQQAVPGGVELLVGGTASGDGWPPVLTVGLGGTATELHRDTADTLAPVTPARALALLRRLRCWPLLAGHRGRPPRDVDAAVDAVVRIGAVLAQRPDLAELEINPLIVGERGAVAVDVLVRTASEPLP